MGEAIDTYEKRHLKELEESIKKTEELKMIKIEMELLKEGYLNEEETESEVVNEKKTTTMKSEEGEKETEDKGEETAKDEEETKETGTEEIPVEEGKKEEKETKSDKKTATKCYYLESYGNCRNKDNCKYEHEICKNLYNREYCIHKNNCW